jgi:hypothetical protein
MKKYTVTLVYALRLTGEHISWSFESDKMYSFSGVLRRFRFSRRRYRLVNLIHTSKFFGQLN